MSSGTEQDTDGAQMAQVAPAEVPDLAARLAEAERLKRNALIELRQARVSMKAALEEAAALRLRMDAGPADEVWARLEAYRARLNEWEEALATKDAAQHDEWSRLEAVEGDLARERTALAAQQRAHEQNRSLLDVGLARLADNRQRFLREQAAADKLLEARKRELANLERMAKQTVIDGSALKERTARAERSARDDQQRHEAAMGRLEGLKAELSDQRSLSQRLDQRLQRALKEVTTTKASFDAADRSSKLASTRLDEARSVLKRRVLLGVCSTALLQDLVAHHPRRLITALGRDIVTSGDGPWSCAQLDNVLGTIGFTTYYLDTATEALPVYVVGREGVEIDDLKAQLEERLAARQPFWLFSQELFVLSLLSGSDLLLGRDAPTACLVSEFAEDHPVLSQFLDGETWDWPTPKPKGGRGQIDFDAGASPLARAGYQVGQTGKAPRERRAVLVRFWKSMDLNPYFLSTHDEPYRKRWGSARGGQRLKRMVQHIQWLLATQGQVLTKYQAAADWTADLNWIRQELWPRVPPSWRWPVG